MFRYFCLLALLVGCAHGRVGQVDTALEKNTISTSTPIFVEPIKADNAAVTGDKSAKKDVVDKEKASIATMYNQKIAEALRKAGYNAKSVATGDGKSGVVITGEVRKIEHGSAAARYFGGMGAGSSNLFTDVKIQDATGKVISKFQVIATSGGEGGVTAMGSYLDKHLANGAKQIVEYIKKSQ